MNTGILITSTWIISFSITLYLVRRYRKADREPEHKLGLKLWETTHTFSEWTGKHRKKAKLALVKK